MKNKILIITLIVLGVALAVSVGVYFINQKNPPIDSSENAVQQNQNSAPANSASENGIGANNQANVGQPQSKIITDDFSISLPSGWKQTAPPVGASAMAVNTDENVSDPAAQKINFKSYFAVSYDTLQGKSLSNFSQTVKDGLLQSIPDAVFTKEQDMTINGNSAHAIETELTQQGANFKVLMVVTAGQGDDVWVISFNTVKSSWDGYKETFYNTANSFIVKK